VKIRYCDSASFAGDTFDKATGLYFRGQRIWEEAVQHLLSIGMASADQVLLTGCSAGGLAAILHCDQFGAFFAGRSTTVKCLADAGLFLDAYVCLLFKLLDRRIIASSRIHLTWLSAAWMSPGGAA
jgi:hypothetical protein